MIVRQILNSKGSVEVLTLPPEATVAEAARLLSERRIGCLVVSGDGVRPDGVISERDIVRQIGAHGPACLQEPISTYMTREVVTCAPGHEAAEVATLMTDGRFRHLPVMDEGRMVGLISMGDVVKARLSELAMEKEALEGMIAGR